MSLHLRPLSDQISRLAAFSILTFCALLSQACQKTEEATNDESDSTQAIPPPIETSPQLEPIVHVPVGKFTLGSAPGEPGRNPSLEPGETQTELGPFRIDAHLYPGEGQAPRLNVSVSEAEALCAAKQGRLCTELEWERACRGPDSARYPGGGVPCQKQGPCLSGFDVAEMGTHLEWTASQFGAASEHASDPVVRGAPSGITAAERRCARRRSGKNTQEVGFRCCYGAPNAASLKEPKLGEAYREIEVTPNDLKALLRSDKRTEALADGARLFKPEAARTVLARGPGDTKGFQLTTQAVEWQPVRGSRFLVVSGTSSGRTSFVVAYFVSDKKKTLAGSFIMKNEPGPIALAYASSIRPRIHFSSCWGCPGETGKVLFREPEELVLLQP